MFSLFNKSRLALLSALVLSTMGTLTAWDDCGCEPCNCNRFYIGAFGGGIYSNSTHISQMGTALFSEIPPGLGPLAVEARGHSKSTSSGFGGVQLGYEWSDCPDACCSNWVFAPAGEIEAFWFSQTKKGHLFNRTDTDRIPEHDFLDTFHLNSGVYLVNAIFSVNNCWGLSPYIGVGVGATRLSIHKADSLQVSPEEPGVNHFNSDRKDSTWTFAAQAKAGLRYTICKSFHIFGEYRYLYVDTSHYVFGSTVYPDHAHTTPWNVKIKDIQYNAFAFGIQVDL